MGNNKKEMFIVAFVKFAEMWARNNIGNNIEVDIPILVSYVRSERFLFIESWKLETLEECYEIIENKILNGFPIWDFFIIPEWTRNMLNLSFNQEVAEIEKQEQKKFICLRNCKHYSESETMLGLLRKCGKEVGGKFGERYEFKLKRQCKEYEE